MKTTYWLVTAAALAAAGVIVYTRMTASGPPVPNVPLTAQAPPPEVPRLALPPVVVPPDETLAMPTGSETQAVPRPLPPVMVDTPPAPVSKSDPFLGPVQQASAVVPVVPPLPVPSLPPMPVPTTVPDSVPVLTAPPVPAAPVEPAVPALPGLATPVAPPPVALPAPKPPAVLPTPPEPPAPLPLPLPAPSVLQPPVGPAPGKSDPLAPVGKFVVLKDDKLIQGDVSVNNDTIVVRQGALDRPFHKSQVQFVAANRDEVYKFMQAKVPATDAAARLAVAKWCMFSGLREQALSEAREVLKLQPTNKPAADLARSLELSLRDFPAEDSPKMSAPAAPTFPAELRHDPLPMPAPAAPVVPQPAPVPLIPPAVLDPEPDVSPEAALVFGSRVQPFLANKCAECHAKPDHAGKFKLVKVDPQQAGPQATRTNLRAVAGQLRKDDPGASPLLLKSLSAHGGMKMPAATRPSAAYQALEFWTALAVGTPTVSPALPVAPQPLPVPPVSPPTAVVPPSAVVPPTLAPPVVDPVLPFAPVPAVPPVAADPVRPLPVPMIADPLLPPVSAPVAPLPKPVAPPAPITPVLPPAPPPPAVPVPITPPFVPPVDTGVKPVPPIPPSTAAPKPPAPVAPASGTQFGSAIPPKVPASGPTGGDEFDPTGFNQRPK